MTETALAQFPISTLIQAVRRCPSISVDRIRHLHDEYRYSGMKTLYLCELEMEAPLEFTDATLNQLTEQAEKSRRDLGLHIPYLDRLQFRDRDPIVRPAAHVEEISYSYVSAVQYTDPETEFPKLADDLRRGFLWISPDHSWLAVCARDQKINQVIVTALEKLFSLESATPTNPEIHSAAIVAACPDSASFANRSAYEHKAPVDKPLYVTRTEKAMIEIQMRDAEDERTACGIRVTRQTGSSLL